jgi:hypothetical protein
MRDVAVVQRQVRIAQGAPRPNGRKGTAVNGGPLGADGLVVIGAVVAQAEAPLSPPDLKAARVQRIEENRKTSCRMETKGSECRS